MYTYYLEQWCGKCGKELSYGKCKTHGEIQDNQIIKQKSISGSYICPTCKVSYYYASDAVSCFQKHNNK